MAKRIMRAFKLHEISAVDRPAQAHAKFTIAKRADDGDEYWKRAFTAEERQQLAREGKAKPDGSYPIVTRGDLENAIHAFGRGGATASDKEWIIRRARALGATDSLPDGWVSKNTPMEVKDMTDEDLKKMVDDAVKAATAPLAEQLAKANATVETLKAKKPMPPNADDGDEPDEDDAKKRAAWKAWAANETANALAAQKAELTKAHETDEVIRVGDLEMRKSSSDPQIFAMIKAQQVEHLKMLDRELLGTFEKKAASVDYAALPGESLAKAHALKAAATLPKEVAETLDKMLKAGAAAMKMQFGERGTSNGELAKADDQIESLAQKHAQDYKVDIATARVAVLETPIGKQLYAQHKAAKQADLRG